MSDNSADYIPIPRKTLSHLVGFTAASPVQGATQFLKQMAREHRQNEPDLSKMIINELRSSPARSVPQAETIGPVDSDSRLSLTREKSVAQLFHSSPILNNTTEEQLKQIINEHQHQEKLDAWGLGPTRTALFVGEPGVGKTLSAEWIARELGIPLLTLDLSSVMSSYLGKTGANVRSVFAHARSRPCVFFLDELDAVAKKRDDTGEIGELKRLVTVLLQEIDYWPSDSLLLAATNHTQLLDPAIWRRFETVVEFPLPNETQINHALQRFLAPANIEISDVPLLAFLFEGETISTIERTVNRALRKSALADSDPKEEVILSALSHIRALPTTARAKAAAEVQLATKMSARSISEITGVSRNTLRKYTQQLQSGAKH